MAAVYHSDFGSKILSSAIVHEYILTCIVVLYICPRCGVLMRCLKNRKFLSDTYQNFIFLVPHYVSSITHSDITFLEYVIGALTAEEGKSFKTNQRGCPEGLGGGADPLIMTWRDAGEILVSI